MASSDWTFHVDPGHGWLQVKYEDVVHLGLKDKITPSSYRAGDDVYLEEDVDAGVFLTEYLEQTGMAKGGLAFAEVVWGSDAPCRGFDSYQPDPVTMVED